MAPSIKLSARSARLLEALLVVLEEQGQLHTYEKQALNELRTSRRPRPSKRLGRERKTQRKTAKNAETAEIRAEVMARAGGVCECGCGQTFHSFNPAELDHARGRGKAPQSVQNTWLLTRNCHREKHHEESSLWLAKYLAHSIRHRHEWERRWAEGRIAFVTARGAA